MFTVSKARTEFRAPARRRVAAIAVLAGLLSAGCAAPPPPVRAQPHIVAAAPLADRGTLATPMSLDTKGPSVISARKVTLQPGGTIGWLTHPGTEMVIVRSGVLMITREGACDPVTYRAGDAFEIPNAAPHLARNDSTEEAELLVMMVLAPGAPEQADVPPAC